MKVYKKVLTSFYFWFALSVISLIALWRWNFSGIFVLAILLVCPAIFTYIFTKEEEKDEENS